MAGFKPITFQQFKERMMAKPEFKVKAGKLVRITEMWPNRDPLGNAHRFVLLCGSDGECEKRGIPDGHPIRTSMIESVDFMTGRVETMNSVYLVSSWES